MQSEMLNKGFAPFPIFLLLVFELCDKEQICRYCLFAVCAMQNKPLCLGAENENFRILYELQFALLLEKPHIYMEGFAQFGLYLFKWGQTNFIQLYISLDNDRLEIVCAVQ